MQANQMNVTVETGEQKLANVYDIIDSHAHGKSFIIYNFDDEPERLYGSILNESEDGVTFEAITNPEEKQYIEAEIQRVAHELENESIA